MRSGVIAQKVGMTRVFTDAGEQVPVSPCSSSTTARSSRSGPAEKNGYTAVQLGVGLRKVKNTPQGAARPFRRAPRSSRSGKSPSSASRPENLIDVGAELTADHFVVGQFVDVTGTSIGTRLPGRHQAPQFRRRPRHPRQLGQPSHPRLDRPAPGPRQGVQGQEDGRPHGRRPRDHAEPEGRQDRRRPRPDHGRGRGAGCQGRLDLRPRRGQARAARRRADARRVQEARGRRRACPAEAKEAE